MKTLLSAAIAAALSFSVSAQAGTLVDINVIDRDTGSILPTHVRDGKLYVAGAPGHRYAVRIVNRSGGRVLTVLSVDGVNAVNGETANPQQTGYVLDPYQSAEVDGWRKSMSEVNQFNFTTLANSYATRTGRPGNVGVIGVAVFRERQQPIQPKQEISSRDALERAPTSDPADAPATAGNPGALAKAQSAAPLAKAEGYAEKRAAPRREDAIGTGYGDREYSAIVYTAFVRESSQPNEVESIWYDSYSNLVARGIIPQPRPVPAEPQAFPQHFVPEPASL
jgi:hypothetical protein